MDKLGSKDPERVHEFNKEYYRKNKEAIMLQRRERLKDAKCKAQVLKGYRDFQAQERKKLFDISVDFIKDLDVGYIPSHLTMEMRHRSIAFEMRTPVKVIEPGSLWKINGKGELKGLDIRRKKTGVLRVYRKYPPPLKRKKVRDPINTPRWIIYGDQLLFLYPVGAFVSLLKKHRWTIDGWIKANLFPCAVDRNGRYWLPDFVVDTAISFLKRYGALCNRSNTEAFKTMLRNRYVGSYHFNVY